MTADHDGDTPMVLPPAPAPRRRRLLPGGFSTFRDLVSFVAGLAVIGHEVFYSDKVEVYALGIGLTLMGLPVVFAADEKRKAP